MPDDKSGSTSRTASISPQPLSTSASPNPQPTTNGLVNPLEKIEQLLTCSICLDRYKHPKLLPCQHSFCLPCLDSYADTVAHKLKCPECRSEHTIPYDGAKSFPNNLTLASFLDIHLEATDDNQEQIEAYIQRYNLERCKICDEKAEVKQCPHCERKACTDCRTAHMEMVKRDLARLLNQVKRLSNRLKEAGECVRKGVAVLTENVDATRQEVKDYFDRYQSELEKRRTHFLNEVDLFVGNETRLMSTLGEKLDAESTNLGDACTWVENVLAGIVEAEAEELCRFKGIFSDGIEYLRNFQPDSDDLFSKKIRFSPGDDAAKLPQAICNFGELTVYMPQFAGRYLPMEQQYLPKPIRLGLESDSYRTSLRAREEERQAKLTEEEKSSSSKAYRRRHTHGDDEWATLRENRLRVSADHGRASPAQQSQGTTPFCRSPFLSPDSAATPPPSQPQEHAPSSSSSSPSGRKARRLKDRSTFIVDEVLLSPNSGLSVREAFLASVQSQSKTPIVTLNGHSNEKPENHEISKAKPSLRHQHASEDDPSLNEKVEKIKNAQEQRARSREMGRSPTPLPSTPTPSTPPPAIPSTNVAEEEEGPAVVQVQRRQRYRIICRSSSQTPSRRSLDLTPVLSVADSKAGTENGANARTGERRASAVALQLPAPGQKYVNVESVAVARPLPPTPPSEIRHPARPHSSMGEPPPCGSTESNNKTPSVVPATGPRKLFGLSTGGEAVSPSRTNDVVDDAPSWQTSPSPAQWLQRRRERMLRSRTNPDIFGSLDPAERQRLVAKANEAQSRKKKQSPEPVDEELPGPSRRRHDSVSRRVQELLNDKELKELLADSTKPPVRVLPVDPPPSDRRSRFTRRLSAHRLSLETTPFNDYGSMAVPKKVFGTKGDRNGQLNWPRGIAAMAGGEFAVADSSNHRIQIFNTSGNLLKIFGSYGSLEGQLDSCAAVVYNRISKNLVVSDRYNHRLQLFDLDGRFLRTFGKHGKENGCFNNPWGLAIDSLGMIYVCDKDNHRIQVFDKNGTFMQKFGSKGDGVGQFNHPLFIAIHSKTQNLFITDSANHRICVMDHNGGPILSFGIEGFGTGQLKLPRGIAVDEQGFVVVADSGNNRVQIFSPDGKFVHGFGCWGQSAGQFKGIEGIALIDGQIVASDRENHRIQIF